MRLKVFVKSDRMNIDTLEGIWDCFVTTENLDTYKVTLEQLAEPSLDEVRLMFLNDKDKFLRVED